MASKLGEQYAALAQDWESLFNRVFASASEPALARNPAIESALQLVEFLRSLGQSPEEYGL